MHNNPPPNGRFIIRFSTVHNVSASTNSRNTSEEEYQKQQTDNCSTISGISCLILWQTGGHRPTSDLPIHPRTTLHQIFQLFQNPCSWRCMKSVEQIMRLLDNPVLWVKSMQSPRLAAKQLFVLVARISDLLPKTHEFVLSTGKMCNPTGGRLYET